jgi:hypothetical protein
MVAGVLEHKTQADDMADDGQSLHLALLSLRLLARVAHRLSGHGEIIVCLRENAQRRLHRICHKIAVAAQVRARECLHHFLNLGNL